MSEIHIPDELEKPELQLIGLDGNAYSIMGAVVEALRKEGNSDEIIGSYRKQAMSGDYNHLLNVSMAFIEFPEEIYDEWD